jgi:hypothetical protein
VLSRDGTRRVRLEIAREAPGSPDPPAAAGGLAVYIVGRQGPTPEEDRGAARALAATLARRRIDPTKLPALGEAHCHAEPAP